MKEEFLVTHLESEAVGKRSCDTFKILNIHFLWSSYELPKHTDLITCPGLLKIKI